MFGLSNFIITEFLLIFYSLVTNVLYSYKFCIDTSVKVGFEYGYKITIVEDAISTFDNIHLSADQILSFYKEKIWRNRFAQLRTTKEILAIN